MKLVILTNLGEPTTEEKTKRNNSVKWTTDLKGEDGLRAKVVDSAIQNYISLAT